MSVIFSITLRGLLTPWRLGSLFVASLVPLISAVIPVPSDPVAITADLISLLTVPVIAIIVAPALFGSEIEDKTLSYFTLSPQSRWKIVIGKATAGFLLAAAFTVFSSVVCISIVSLTDLGSDTGTGNTVVAVAVGSIASLTAYMAVMLWMGLMFTRPLVISFLFVLIWELGINQIRDFIFGSSSWAYLIINSYSLRIMNAIDESVGNDDIATIGAIIGVLIVGIIFTTLAILKLRRMDVP